MRGADDQSMAVQSVGLGGDGDEIEAIEDVEKAFGVKFDPTEASNWHSAGDLFSSLCTLLPAHEIKQDNLWDRFAIALTGVTGVDPKMIKKDSPLIDINGPWSSISRSRIAVWILLVVAALLVFGLRAF